MFIQKKNHLALFQEKRASAEHPAAINPNHVYEEFKARLGLNGRVAGILTGIYRAMWFVYFPILFIGGWIAAQAWIGGYDWNPYPLLLLLIVGDLIQLLGGPIIQVGQHLASVHSELRAEATHEVHKKSFTDIEAMQSRLEKLEIENRELLEWIKENAVIHVSEEARTLKGPAPVLPLEAFSAGAAPALPTEAPNAE
jgi:uncharacterized membrane protein